jgi:hypothetical protein
MFDKPSFDIGTACIAIPALLAVVVAVVIGAA